VPDIQARIVGVHSAPLVNGRDQELDLHWYSLWLSAPDEDFWRAATPARIGGADTMILSPPDQLLQICVHGCGWPTLDSIRWIADAVTLVRASEDGFDWDRLVDQARKRALTLPMLDSLSYLRAAFGIPVPDAVLQRLRDSDRAPREALARRANRRRATPPRILVAHWDRYRRLKTLDPDAPRGRSFAEQIRLFYGEPSYPALLRRFGRRLLHGSPVA
jgi:hypothetical protein